MLGRNTALMLPSSSGPASSCSALTTQKEGRPDCSATGSNAGSAPSRDDALEEPGDGVDLCEETRLASPSSKNMGHKAHAIGPVLLANILMRGIGLTGSSARRRDAAMMNDLDETVLEATSDRSLR